MTGLPRSRTAWFAAYLPNCSHEGLKELKTRSDFNDLMRRYDGLSDSVLMLTDFQSRFDGPTLIIERPVDEVLQSLSRLGINAEGFIEHCERELRKVNGLRVPFCQINDCLPEICRYLDVKYDEQRSNLFCKLNIQTTDLTPSQALRIWV